MKGVNSFRKNFSIAFDTPGAIQLAEHVFRNSPHEPDSQAGKLGDSLQPDATT